MLNYRYPDSGSDWGREGRSQHLPRETGSISRRKKKMAEQKSLVFELELDRDSNTGSILLWVYIWRLLNRV